MVDSNEHCIGGVWRFDGANWSHVAGTGQLGSWTSPDSTSGLIGVNALTVHDDLLLASTSAGTEMSVFPAWSFDGNRWSAIGADSPSQPTGHFFDFIDVIDGAILVGGGGEGDKAPYIWAYDRAQWNRFDHNGIDRLVDKNSTSYLYDMALHDGYIYGVLGSG